MFQPYFNQKGIGYAHSQYSPHPPLILRSSCGTKDTFATGVRLEDDLVGKVKILLAQVMYIPIQSTTLLGLASCVAASINDHGRLGRIYRSLSKHFNTQLSDVFSSRH